MGEQEIVQQERHKLTVKTGVPYGRKEGRMIICADRSPLNDRVTA